MTSIQIKVSSEFKAQTAKAIAFISLFILTYILMLSLAVGLTVLGVDAGIFLILHKPMFNTIVLGFGLGSLGILVLFFLLKFIVRPLRDESVY